MLMTPSPEELSWWREAAWALIGTLGGFFAGGVRAGRTAKEWESMQEALKRHLEGHAEACAEQRQQIYSDLRTEINGIVRDAVSGMNMSHIKELAAVDKTLALQAQCLQHLVQQIKELHDRLDRREGSSQTGMHQSGYDYGKRRSDGSL